MRHLLAIICGFALLGAIIGFVDRQVGTSRLPFGDGTFTIFVVSGGISTALYYLHELRRDAKAQTAALEEILRNTRKGDKPAESSVHYRIPGLNE